MEIKERPFLTLNRHYPVAPEKVYRAWTDAKAIKRWWGPAGPDAVAVAELDVRVGGRFRICFGGPQGNDHEITGVYREVVPNRKLVFTWTWPRTTPERQSVVALVFRAVQGGTALDLRHEQLFDETVRDNHRRGWTESLVKLEEFLRAGTTG